MATPGRYGIEIIPVADKTMINVTMVLADGITRLVQITCLKLWIIGKLNLVGSMGHIEVCPCTQILVPCFIHLQAQLVTLGIHRT